MTKEQIREALEALVDIRGAMINIGITDKHNPALYINEVVEAEDSFTAQALVDAETTSVASQESNAYLESREQAFKAIDNELLEAMVEKEQGDDTKWQAYLVKRAAIKVQFPKPE